MNISYYPGCTIKTSAKNYETSAIAALKWLGANLVEMEDWNCCGVVHSLSTDDLYHQIAPVRVLLHHQEQSAKEDLVTMCDMCYNTLSQANVLVKANPEQLNTLNTFMDEEKTHYEGDVNVLHMLQVLRDKVGFDTIRKKVRRPLEGMKVFPYYGCMVLRPGEVSIDNPEDPRIMGDLMEALGAKVIDDPMKNECCGSYHTVDNRDIVYDRVNKIVSRALAKGADAIVLSCPLCRFNLDTRQHDSKSKIESPIPVFYYTQLMCMAFGLEEEVMGLEDHKIDPKPMVHAMAQS